MDTNKRVRNVWYGMMQRCYNPQTRSYKWYGGKGITVCDEWRNFKGFKTWALTSGYKEGLSIERIDNGKGYSPNNCKWIPLSEQAKNRKSNHYITINGKTKTLSDWARCLKIKKSTLCKRLIRGFSKEDALNNTRQVSSLSKCPELDKMIYSKFSSKTQMAKEIGWERNKLTRIARKEQCPTVDETYELSVALDVPFMAIANIFLRKEK